MAIPSANNHTPNLSRSLSVAETVCKTRTNLLDRLAAAVESLGRAKLFLETESSGNNPYQEQSLRYQVDVLRLECGTIRRELEFHRLSHGC
jgi:hypothetical protein